MKHLSISALCVVLPVLGGAWPTKTFAVEIIDARDTLDKAVAGPALIGGSDEDILNIYVADREQYDSNVFRLPSGTNAATVVGPSASKEDQINSPAAGLDGQWIFGRQSIALAVRADDNLYAHNSDLNNVSSNDKLVWNWGLGSVLSGQVGADYLRQLASFINTNVYTRNVYQRTEAFAAGRYQIGPRWAIYGGVMNTEFSLAQSASKGNNSHQKSVDVGAELATNVDDSFGWDYRYTDARYPNAIVLNASQFDPDYREDRARFLLKRALTVKTSIDLSAGYLKRDYGNPAIGSFTGPIWRASLGWQPTDKTQLIGSTWRDLQAYFTDQTNYYRATGVSLTPTWMASEKITVSLLLTREAQAYIGSSAIAVSEAARRDTLNAEAASFSYAATRALLFDVTFRHEQRSSNVQLRTYTDELASAGVKFTF
jgi:exopolysaccharide biosynthesis operon protein EpsL